MDCENTRKRLSVFISGELDCGETLDVKDHLADCPACSAELDKLRSAVVALGKIPDVPPSPLRRERAVSAMAAAFADEKARRSARFRKVASRLAVAAAIMVAILGATFGPRIFRAVFPKPSDFTVDAHGGYVQVQKSGAGAWTAASEEMKLTQGDIVHCSADGWATLKMGDSGTVTLNHDTLICVGNRQSGKGPVSFTLLYGEVWVEIDDRTAGDAGETFRVYTPDRAYVDAKGTKFNLKYR